MVRLAHFVAILVWIVFATVISGCSREPQSFQDWFREHRMECFACRHADEEGIEVCSDTYWKLYAILHTDLKGVPEKEIARNLGLHCIRIEDMHHWERLDDDEPAPPEYLTPEEEAQYQHEKGGNQVIPSA